MNAPECGLYTPQHQQIPLEGVAIKVSVTDRSAEVTVAHRYRNKERVDVEAVYVFPLEESAAVSGFRARVGDRLIEGRVEERERAFEIYDDAMADGHGAFLLDQERPNIFTASVGNIKAGAEVIVEVSYVALLNVEGPAIRLMLPTTISPRYVPAGPPEVGQPDGERINPPTMAQVPYGLTLEVVVNGSGLRGVESPSHPVRTRFEDSRAVVTLSSDSVALDRDFVLLIEPKDAHAPRAAVARESDGTRVAMLTFYPDPAAGTDTPSDVTFVIDCSGSMGGDSIAQARRALALCVRALAEGDRFNIVRFGSHYTQFWPEPQVYSQTTLDQATRYIDATDANMGGTEVLQPLQAILTAPASPGRPRQVLLLTDGEVSNEDQVIALCQAHRSTSRVFTFGIGAGASEHLVRGVARASGGAAEFIYPGERIESKVLRMFGRIKTPAYTDIRVDWNGMEVEQAPATIASIFAGDALTVLARIRHGVASSVALKAGDRTWTLPLDLEHAELDGPIPKLWARAAIRDLEDGQGGRRGSNQDRARGDDRSDRRHRRLVELGTRYGLMSSVTSYVAVEVRAEDDKSVGQAQLRRVPVALTAGWGGQGSVTGGAGYGKGGQVATAQSVGRMVQLTPPMPSPQKPAAPMPPPPSAPMPVAPGGPPPMRPAPAMSAAPSPPPVGAAARRYLCFDDDVRPATETRKREVQRDQERKESVVDKVAGFFDRLVSNERSAPPEPTPIAGFAAEEAEASAALSFGDEPMAADHLFDLLLTQRADGAFTLAAPLRHWVTVPWAQVEAAGRIHGQERLATSLVLAILERKAADRKAEWTAAARKAEAWLARNGGRVDVSALV